MYHTTTLLNKTPLCFSPCNPSLWSLVENHACTAAQCAVRPSPAHLRLRRDRHVGTAWMPASLTLGTHPLFTGPGAPGRYLKEFSEATVLLISQSSSETDTFILCFFSVRLFCMPAGSANVFLFSSSHLRETVYEASKTKSWLSFSPFQCRF